MTDEPARTTASDMFVYLDDVVQTTGWSFSAGADPPSTPDKVIFSTAPGAGEIVKITYFDEVLVGNARALTYDISRTLTDVIGVGFWKPQLIKEGRIEYTGSIEHFMTDSQFWDAINPATFYAPEYVIQCKVGSATVTKKATFIGVKFETHGGEHPQDDFAIESIDWRARDAKFSEAV